MNKQAPSLAAPTAAPNEIPPRTLVFYISSHGFGHAVRAMEIIRNLPRGFHVVIKSQAPEWLLCHQLGGRSFEYVSKGYDCGCVQIDAATIDWRATFAAFDEMERRNARRLDSEARDIERRSAVGVVSDIPSFALEAAARAGVPGMIATNFTWAEIYERGLDLSGGANTSMTDRLRQAYAQADLLMRTPFCLPLDYFPRVRDVPLVARVGRPMREAVCRRLSLDADRPIYLVYVGMWGLEMMEWERLAALRPSQFVVMGPLPSAKRCPPNLISAPRDAFRHEDLTASVDAVIAKPGYGICAECVAASTPLLYCGRDDFAEFPPMDRDLKRWGGAIRLADADFTAFRLQPYLDAIPDLTMDPQALPYNGAEVCARMIEERIADR